MSTEISPIVEADWLIGRRAAGADVVVVHVGTTMVDVDPRQRYLDQHIDGAVYVSLDDDLAGPPAGRAGRHPLPAPPAFRDVLERAGIGMDSEVVAYDDRNGAFAARLIWMLRIIGQPAALLDRGLDAWTADLERGDVATASVSRAVIDWPSDAVADADEVAAHVAAGGVVIDSRDADRYAGRIEPIDPIAGHVPGAINLPFAANLGADGAMLDAASLALRFAPLTSDAAPIVYCGSGVTACHNAVAIEAAGLSRPRVYVGSWSGWSNDPERPVATEGDTADA